MARSDELPASVSLYLEQLWPWLVAGIGAGAWIYLERPFPTAADGLYGTAATIASVFAGFVSAAGAIILTIKDTAIYRELSKHGYIDDIVAYLRIALSVATVFAAVSLAGFFVSTSSETEHVFQQIFRLAWVYVALLSFFTFLRASRILFLLLRQSTR